MSFQGGGTGGRVNLVRQDLDEVIMRHKYGGQENVGYQGNDLVANTETEIHSWSGKGYFYYAIMYIGSNTAQTSVKPRVYLDDELLRFYKTDSYGSYKDGNLDTIDGLPLKLMVYNANGTGECSVMINFNPPLYFNDSLSFRYWVPDHAGYYGRTTWFYTKIT